VLIVIDTMARKMAYHIKEANPDHPASFEVLNFALVCLLNLIGCILISISLGIIFDRLPQTFMALGFFALLRIVSGGYHLKSSFLCAVLSAVAAVTVTFIPLSQISLVAITVISMILAYFFAPSKYINKTSRIPPRYYPMLKYITILLVASNLIFQSDIIAICFFIQCISLIWSGGESE
jgi:accessory gene regulator B